MTSITTASPAPAPGRAELVGRARDILPVLKANAALTETEGRLSAESLSALVASGLFRLRVPRQWGGYEADIQTFVDVVSELGRGCGTASWLAFILNANDWIMGLYPESAQRAVYGKGPDVRIAGIFESAAEARRQDGGMTIDGRWPFASGCHHSDWAMLGFFARDAEGNPVDQLLALVPMRDLEVEPSWNVAGMSGTGSDTLVGNDIFVPDDRIISFSEAARGLYAGRSPGVIYRAPFVPAAVLAVLPPVLGLARGALDVTLERLGQGKRVAYTFRDDARQAPATQFNIARAANLIDSAFLHAHRSAAAIDGAAERGEDMDFHSRARLRMDCGYAAQCCRDAVDILLNVQGASAFALSNPLQRIWRDLETASRHGLLDTGTCQEIYGRALLGIEERTTVLI